MAGIRIRNKEDFERWLNGIADENQRRRTAIALATRMGMRLFLTAEIWLKHNEEKATQDIITLFWFMEILNYSLIANKEKEVKRHVSGMKFPKEFVRGYKNYYNDYVYFAFLNISGALALDGEEVYSLIISPILISCDALSKYNNCFDTLSHDANISKKGINELLTAPLWPQGTPDWAADLWQSMKSRLLARKNEHWEVWTNWYDARLDPSRPIPCYSPPDMELERQRVLLPEDLWEQGPATVNAAIKELIENHGCSRQQDSTESKDSTEIEQTPAPYIFEENAQGQIIARPYKGEIHNPQFTETLRQELKTQAVELLDLLEGKQVPERVRKTVVRLIEVLGNTLDDVEPGRLQSASRALEADFIAYDSEAGRQELGEDGFAGLHEVVHLTADLRAQFMAITEMQARSEAQKILEIGPDRINAQRKEAIAHIEATEAPEIDRESVSRALHASDEDIEEVQEELLATTDAEKQAYLKEKLAQLLAIDLLTLRNFAAKAINKARCYGQAARNDLEQDSGMKVGVALGIGAAITTIFSPASPMFALIAGLAASNFTGWRMLKREAERIWQEMEEQKETQEDENEGENEEPSTR